MVSGKLLKYASLVRESLNDYVSEIREEVATTPYVELQGISIDHPHDERVKRLTSIVWREHRVNSRATPSLGAGWSSRSEIRSNQEFLWRVTHNGT